MVLTLAVQKNPIVYTTSQTNKIVISHGGPQKLVFKTSPDDFSVQPGSKTSVLEGVKRVRKLLH